MGALAAAVRPFAGGVARGAATGPCASSERACEKKPQLVAPTRGSEFYVANQKRKMMTRNRNNVENAADTKVFTAGGETVSAQKLLQKRLACELDALRGLLKKAELISRRGACKGGGAPAAGEKERRFLASKQRPELMMDGGGNEPPVKRRKISNLVEQKQIRAPRMSPEERTQLAGRLSSMSEELPGHIVEFLLRQFGDADSGGEIEIDIDSVEDSVLFELKAQLDKFAQERRPIVVGVLPEEKDWKLAEKSKRREGEDVHICAVSTIFQTGIRSSSRSRSASDTSSDSDCKRCSDEFTAQWEALPEQIVAMSAQPPSSSERATGTAAQSGEAKKVQDDVQRAAPKTVYLPGLIYRAKVRRQLMEMEKAVLPDQSIHRPDLQRLCIAECGRPSVMWQLGLVLKADA